MAVNLVVNNVTFAFPTDGALQWGSIVTGWATAITNGLLQKSGGLFTLTNEVDFGANFGLKALYYKSRSSNIAASGILRLANTDNIAFRNAGNTADNLVGSGSVDNLLAVNAIDLVNISTAQTLTNKSMSGSANTFTNIPDSAFSSSYLKANGSVALTGNWSAGAFSATFNSVVVGGSAGLITAAIFKSSTTNPAAQGVLRLANTETIAWRNAGNTSEKILSLNASDNFTLNSALDMQGNALDVVSTLQFAGSSSGFLVHQAAAATTSYTLTWPSAQGAANSFLQNNGSGVLSWGSSITGNAATATALQTARNINGVAFDGTASITVTAAAGTLTGATLNSSVTASSLTSVGTLINLTVTNPITGSVTGNAATATALQNARTINGTSFDGTTNIVVTAAAGTLTGTTLNATVVTSSLTSVGTLASLIVTGTTTAGSFIPTSSTTPANGLYLGAANSPSISANTTFVGRWTDSSFISAVPIIMLGATSTIATQIGVNGLTASLILTGGNAVSAGGAIELYGSTHATKANIIEFYTSNALCGQFAASGAFSALGTNTNDSAATGYIGEYIESLISTPTNVGGLTTAWGNMTSISLTKGDWEVTGIAYFTSNGATVLTTGSNMAISVNSGATTTDQVVGSNQIPVVAPGAAGIDRGACLSSYRILINATTTVYLKSQFSYSVATPQFQCRLSARRMR